MAWGRSRCWKHVSLSPPHGGQTGGRLRCTAGREGPAGMRRWGCPLEWRWSAWEAEQPRCAAAACGRHASRWCPRRRCRRSCRRRSAAMGSLRRHTGRPGRRLSRPGRHMDSPGRWSRHLRAPRACTRERALGRLARMQGSRRSKEVMQLRTLQGLPMLHHPPPPRQVGRPVLGRRPLLRLSGCVTVGSLPEDGRQGCCVSVPASLTTV